MECERNKKKSNTAESYKSLDVVERHYHPHSEKVRHKRSCRVSIVFENIGHIAIRMTVNEFVLVNLSGLWGLGG